MLLYAAAQRRRDADRADLAEAIAIAYSSCRVKDGSGTLTRWMNLLRRK